jgi:hypothetical protein
MSYKTLAGGLAYKNTEKVQGTNVPDYTGKLNVEGPILTTSSARIAMWIKDGNLSFSITEKEDE